MRIVVIFIVILYPKLLQAGLLADYPTLDVLQFDRDSLDCCPGQYEYDLLYGLRDEDGKIVGWNDPVAGYIENNPPTGVAHKLGRGLSLGALPEMKAVGGVWKAVSSGKKAAEKSTNVLKPLGRGSTGRTIANNLNEQLAMKEIMANPSTGRIVMRNMKDASGRWHGWDKMQYIKTLNDKTKIVIHYVGKFENGILKAVDDFKFK